MMLGRLWMVLGGIEVNDQTQWDIIASHDNDSIEMGKMYNDQQGSKILLTWNVLKGITIWAISHKGTVYGKEQHNPNLPWEVLCIDERVKLYPRIEDAVVKYVKSSAI